MIMTACLNKTALEAADQHLIMPFNKMASGHATLQ